ncbi:hypothetical protein BGX33_004333 [Mortierella sp. NVP41]|nr:hypothetical protein BGX33_004333 [Mortierella sp. NVP41]
MVKLGISTFLLAQLCILQAHASHYIQFRLIKKTDAVHRAGICLHAGNGIIMSDSDDFASIVKNYGFHKDGWQPYFKMVKIAFSAVLLAQICILQAYASHYIQFRLYKDTGVLHRVGICLHDGDRALMADQDYFGSSVQNYGFHKDGYAANVKWDNKEVDVQGWGRYKFKNIWSNGHKNIWDDCWETSSRKCNTIVDKATSECNRALGF